MITSQFHVAFLPLGEFLRWGGLHNFLPCLRQNCVFSPVLRHLEIRNIPNIFSLSLVIKNMDFWSYWYQKTREYRKSRQGKQCSSIHSQKPLVTIQAPSLRGKVFGSLSFCLSCPLFKPRGWWNSFWNANALLKARRYKMGVVWRMLSWEKKGRREGCTSIPYLKLHIGTHNVRHIFTRNRKNIFCSACYHCKFCHCMSFSVSSSRYSLMRKVCSIKCLTIRENKNKPQAALQ